LDFNFSKISFTSIKNLSSLKKKIVAVSNQPVNVFDKYKIFNPLGQEIISKPFKAGVYFLIKR
jgi:hypothetical protein